MPSWILEKPFGISCMSFIGASINHQLILRITKRAVAGAREAERSFRV
jgi:hypothetical protein